MARLPGGSRSGFTLIELIAVAVILSILAAVAVAGIAPGSMAGAAEAETVKAHLRYAQGRAMNDVVDWQLVFTANGYTLQKADGAAVPPLPGGTGPTHAFGGGVTCANPVTVSFDEWGSPGANTITLNLAGGGGGTITITRNTGFIP